MKRTKNIHILVFGLLNALNLIAAVVLMIYSSFQPKPLNWDPPIFFLSVVFCVPIAVVINFAWLMTWFFMTNRAKKAFVILNSVAVGVMLLVALYFSLINYEIDFTLVFPNLISELKYFLPVFAVINGAWLIVTLSHRKKQKRSSEG